jgi:hypothetical protein
VAELVAILAQMMKLYNEDGGVFPFELPNPIIVTQLAFDSTIALSLWELKIGFIPFSHHIQYVCRVLGDVVLVHQIGICLSIIFLFSYRYIGAMWYGMDERS